MNQSYPTKQHRALSENREDASSEGMVTNSCIPGRESLMKSVVKAASAFNNILLENCSICTLYCDKQVQYEEIVRQQYDVGTGAMGHLYSQLNATAAATSITPSNVVAAASVDGDKNSVDNSDFINPTNTHLSNHAKSPSMASGHDRIEVERYYREFLFDEESVVRSVGSRGAADDEE